MNNFFAPEFMNFVKKQVGNGKIVETGEKMSTKSFQLKKQINPKMIFFKIIFKNFDVKQKCKIFIFSKKCNILKKN